MNTAGGSTEMFRMLGSLHHTNDVSYLWREAYDWGGVSNDLPVGASTRDLCFFILRREMPRQFKVGQCQLGAVPESSPIFQIMRAIGQTICLSITPHRSRVTDEIFPEYVGAADEIGDCMKGVRGGVRGDDLVDGGDVEGDGSRFMPVPL